MYEKPLFGFVDGAEGVQKLFTAILSRAIRDYSMYLGRNDTRHLQIAVDAWEWLMSDDESAQLTTFVDVCRILDQCPTMVRSKVAELVEHERDSTGALPVTTAA